MSGVEVAFLPPDAAHDAALVADLAERINAAYAVAEEELWVPGKDRVSTDAVAAIVANGEMAVARLEGRIVGSVRVRTLDPQTGFLGLLAVEPAAQGAGVGSELIRFAEDVMRDAGATQMELRLLVPRDGPDSGKERLHEWYSRLGYRITARSDFAQLNEDAAGSMLMPLDLLTYRKPLVQAAP